MQPLASIYKHIVSNINCMHSVTPIILYYHTYHDSYNFKHTFSNIYKHIQTYINIHKHIQTYYHTYHECNNENKEETKLSNKENKSKHGVTG